MRSRSAADVVLAGLIASVVVACSDGLGDMVGEGLVDAGRALSDAGAELLGDAGVALYDAGRALSDAGEVLIDGGRDGAVRDAAAQGCDCPLDERPNPRWVLRDKDEVAVEALVQQTCGHDVTAAAYTTCAAISNPTASQFPCAWVSFMGNRFVNLQYNLATGSIAGCTDPARTVPGPLQQLPNPPYTLDLVY